MTKAQYLPLFVTNHAVQFVSGPREFVSNVSQRLFGRTVTPRGNAAPSFPESLVHTPIVKSGRGAFNGRVLHVLTNSLPHSRGGYAYRSHHILQAQAKAGLPAFAITRLGYPICVGKFPEGKTEVLEGVNYFRSLPTHFPFNLERQIEAQAEFIYQEARKLDISVLHVTTPWTNAAAASLAAKKLKIPWVYEVRGEPEGTWAASQPADSYPEVTDYYLKSRQKEEEAMRHAAAVVVLSEVSKRALQQRGIEGPIVIAPNAVDREWAASRMPKEDARALLGLPPRRYVGAISSLVDYEGFDDLIMALHFLPKDVSVLLVGGGKAASSLKSLAVDQGLADRVIFAGHQPRSCLAQWYSALDVFAMPRKDYGVTRFVTPMKSLQAQAFGIPVVASDLPALREVTRGEAIYAKSDDPVHLAETICQVLEEPLFSVADLPSWDEVVSTFLHLYESL